MVIATVLSDEAPLYPDDFHGVDTVPPSVRSTLPDDFHGVETQVHPLSSSYAHSTLTGPDPSPSA